MAIEDAWVLSQCLQGPGGVGDGLAAYASARRARTAKVQLTARANAGLFHHREPTAQLKAYAPQWLAAKVSPGRFHARQDWLYGHDVTLS